MARLRGDLEIVRHLLPAARAHSGEVGIITGMTIVHIYEERYDEETKDAMRTPTAFNASAKAKATPFYASNNRAVTTQPCECW